MARTWSWWAIALGAGLVWATPRRAEAQAFQLVRKDTPERLVEPRDEGQDASSVYTVSRSDCLAFGDKGVGKTGDVFTFSGTQTGLEGYALEVWATQSSGVDCADPIDRSTAAGVCWQVAEVTSFQGPAFTVSVRVQDVAHAEKPTSVNKGTPEDCTIDPDDPEAQSTNLPLTYNLFFFATAGDTNVGSSTESVGMKIDLLGPTAPTLGNVVSGEGAFAFSWKEPSSTDIEGYDFFCEPVAEDDYEQACEGSASDNGGASGDGGSGGTKGGAGAGGEGGVGGGGGAGGGAGYQSALQGGKPPPTDGVLRCDHVAAGQLSHTVEGVKNYVTYRVAMSAVDRVGNAGDLSEVRCVRAVPVDDFYRLYREAGGEAGGGCSVKPPGRTRGVFAAIAAFGALALTRSRRRNSARSSAPR